MGIPCRVNNRVKIGNFFLRDSKNVGQFELPVLFLILAFEENLNLLQSDRYSKKKIVILTYKATCRKKI
jgi:hypothetical protein